jgi:hypothetical protein
VKFPEGFDTYVRSIALGRTNDEIAELASVKFSISLTSTQIKDYKHNHKISSGFDTKFKKGHRPVNAFPKGHRPANAFKTGHKPWNSLPVGSEVVKSNGYLWIKTSEPNIWKPKHVVLWESVNGEVPKDKKLFFLDGDNTNISIDNLELVSNHEILTLNENRWIKSNPEFTKAGLTLTKLTIKLSELQNNNH